MANTSATYGTIAKSFNGARAILVLNNVTVGTAQNVSVQAAFTMDPVFTLGAYPAQELVPNQKAPVVGSLRSVRFFNASPYQFLSIPNLNNGTPTGLLENQDFTIQVQDRQNKNAPLMQINRCRITNYSIDVAANQTAEITINFIGINDTDEFLTTSNQADASQVGFGVA